MRESDLNPPDLRVMSSKNAVLYRVTSCEKALKTLAFWILRLVSFCNFVELFVMELNFC